MRAVSPPPRPTHKQVLVLYSTRPDNQFSIIGERELPRILDVGPRTDLDYYSEFIDLSRFPDPSHPILIANFLRQKYRGTRFDVVIAMQDVAVQFLKENRESLFPDVPVVYLANDTRNASVRAELHGSHPGAEVHGHRGADRKTAT